MQAITKRLPMGNITVPQAFDLGNIICFCLLKAYVSLIYQIEGCAHKPFYFIYLYIFLELFCAMCSNIILRGKIYL